MVDTDLSSNANYKPAFSDAASRDIELAINTDASQWTDQLSDWAFYEMMIFNTPLTPTQYTCIETYMKEKYLARGMM